MSLCSFSSVLRHSSWTLYGDKFYIYLFSSLLSFVFLRLFIYYSYYYYQIIVGTCMRREGNWWIEGEGNESKTKTLSLRIIHKFETTLWNFHLKRHFITRRETFEHFYIHQVYKRTVLSVSSNSSWSRLDSNIHTYMHIYEKNIIRH